jgi:hypothetical protein
VSTGYDFSRAQLQEQLIKMQFPERTPKEASIIRDWLLRHVDEYDRFSLSVRVGKGIVPDPTHDAGVQSSTAFSSKKRIDILAWQGSQPFLFEVKERLIPGALGQLLIYRDLWLEENPDAKDPILGAIARTSDDDTNRIMQNYGVTIYLIPASTAGGGTGVGGVSPTDAPAASGS